MEEESSEDRSNNWLVSIFGVILIGMLFLLGNPLPAHATKLANKVRSTVVLYADPLGKVLIIVLIPLLGTIRMKSKLKH